MLNALAAVAIADGRGVPRDAIEEALATFRGVARRLQIRGEIAGDHLVDDFAHHPTAIRATIEAARSRWPGRRLWVAFEPRSNTMRRRIFEDDLAGSLAAADGAVLGPVNRAQLLAECRAAFARARGRERARARDAAQRAFESSSGEIAEFLAAELREGDVMLMLSNGSFDGLVRQADGAACRLKPLSEPASGDRAQASRRRFTLRFAHHGAQSRCCSCALLSFSRLPRSRARDDSLRRFPGAIPRNIPST